MTRFFFWTRGEGKEEEMEEIDAIASKASIVDDEYDPIAHVRTDDSWQNKDNETVYYSNDVSPASSTEDADTIEVRQDVSDEDIVITIGGMSFVPVPTKDETRGPSEAKLFGDDIPSCPTLDSEVSSMRPTEKSPPVTGIESTASSVSLVEHKKVASHLQEQYKAPEVDSVEVQYRTDKVNEALAACRKWRGQVEELEEPTLGEGGDINTVESNTIDVDSIVAKYCPSYKRDPAEEKRHDKFNLATVSSKSIDTDSVIAKSISENEVDPFEGALLSYEEKRHDKLNLATVSSKSIDTDSVIAKSISENEVGSFEGALLSYEEKRHDKLNIATVSSKSIDMDSVIAKSISENEVDLFEDALLQYVSSWNSATLSQPSTDQLGGVVSNQKAPTLEFIQSMTSQNANDFRPYISSKDRQPQTTTRTDEPIPEILRSRSNISRQGIQRNTISHSPSLVQMNDSEIDHVLQRTHNWLVATDEVNNATKQAMPEVAIKSYVVVSPARASDDEMLTFKHETAVIEEDEEQDDAFIYLNRSEGLSCPSSIGMDPTMSSLGMGPTRESRQEQQASHKQVKHQRIITSKSQSIKEGDDDTNSLVSASDSNSESSESDCYPTNHYYGRQKKVRFLDLEPEPSDSDFFSSHSSSSRKNERSVVYVVEKEEDPVIEDDMNNNCRCACSCGLPQFVEAGIRELSQVGWETDHSDDEYPIE